MTACRDGTCGGGDCSHCWSHIAERAGGATPSCQWPGCPAGALQAEGGCSWNERGGFHPPDCPHITNVHPHRCCGLAHACTGDTYGKGTGCGSDAGAPCIFEEVGKHG